MREKTIAHRKIRWLAILPAGAALAVLGWSADPGARTTSGLRATAEPAAAPEATPFAEPAATAAGPTSSLAVEPRADASTPADASAPTPVSPPGTAGMVVGLDPETGEMGMASRAQIEALGLGEDPAVSRSTEGLTEIRRADGAVGIDLQGRFQNYSVLRIGPDGRHHLECSQGPLCPTHAQRPASPEEK